MRRPLATAQAAAVVLLLAGCAVAPQHELAVSLYDLTPEQCEAIETQYMTALVSLEPDADELDRLTCRLNKCAAIARLRAGLDGRDGYDVSEQTHFAYAPEALGGQSCR